MATQRGMPRAEARRAPGPGPVVVHLTTVHSWNDNRIFYRECSSLARAGFRVVLVAPDGGPEPPPDAPVRVVGVPIPPGRLGRVARGLIRVGRAARAQGGSVYHLHDPELLLLAPLLRRGGARVVYDAHEDLPHNVLGKHYIPRGARRAVSLLAHVLVWVAGHACDHVVAATTTVAARFPSGRRTVVRNFPLLEPGADADPAPYEQRSRIVVYVGALSADRGVRELLAAADGLPDGWTLHLVGSCRAENLLVDIREAVRRGRVEYHGQLPPAVARGVLRDARIGVVVLRPTPAYLTALPTKLFEYMAAGLPVVASDFPLWRDIVAGADCGELVDPGDPEALAGALRALALDEPGAARRGRRGRDAVTTTYRWESEERALLGVYTRLVGGPGRGAVR